jgi:abortive infection bacteriophage resistance protein
MVNRPIIEFSKSALSVPELVEHLKSRGLQVIDDAAVERALSLLGYHRLLPYMRSLQTQAKRFVDGTTIADVIGIYEADWALRFICLSAIGRVEIALRAAIANQVAVVGGSHFHFENQPFHKPRQVY